MSARCHACGTKLDPTGWCSWCNAPTALNNVKNAQERWETAQRQEREARAGLEQAVREARKTMTLAVIAQELGVSRQRVEQMSKEEK